MKQKTRSSIQISVCYIWIGIYGYKSGKVEGANGNGNGDGMEQSPANPFMIISQECRPLIRQVPGVQKKVIQA